MWKTQWPGSLVSSSHFGFLELQNSFCCRNELRAFELLQLANRVLINGINHVKNILKEWRILNCFLALTSFPSSFWFSPSSLYNAEYSSLPISSGSPKTVHEKLLWSFLPWHPYVLFVIVVFRGDSKLIGNGSVTWAPVARSSMNSLVPDLATVLKLSTRSSI
jgi:hypothetical protein